MSEESVAIEDTAVNLPAPLGAGIATVAVPGAYTAEQDFSAAALVVDSHEALGFEQLGTLLG